MSEKKAVSVQKEKKVRKIGKADLSMYESVLPFDSNSTLKYTPKVYEGLGTIFELRPMTIAEKKEYKALRGRIRDFYTVNVEKLKEDGPGCNYIDTSDEEEEIEKIIFDCIVGWTKYKTKTGKNIEFSYDNYQLMVQDFIKIDLQLKIHELSGMAGLNRLEDSALGC